MNALSFLHLLLCELVHSRAGGNGTAGTAMAIPVFEGEKWRRLDSNLDLRYGMSSSWASL